MPSVDTIVILSGGDVNSYPWDRGDDWICLIRCRRKRRSDPTEMNAYPVRCAWSNVEAVSVFLSIWVFSVLVVSHSIFVFQRQENPPSTVGITGIEAGQPEVYRHTGVLAVVSIFFSIWVFFVFRHFSLDIYLSIPLYGEMGMEQIDRDKEKSNGGKIKYKRCHIKGKRK
ncbi:hypothetical protein L2E82_31508 [Cichorium intybus]|uniref:Uncharacterized protein n=1 Tax=Cichorium intybus TaxID=13427 RepID=A0ACB9BFG0_CICIN|nr:hypothetical protein L2E82_31508 [Cichorium intybus]